MGNNNDRRNDSKNIIAQRILRDKFSDRYEVLDKVKKLLLLAGTDCFTILDVADYYEVTVDAIQKVYQRNKDEIDEDGVKLMSAKMLIGQTVHLVKTVESLQSKKVITYSDGRVVEIPNRGIKVFPKRAILRIGMLLTESSIAREIRSQLLNIEEKVSNTTRTQDIDEEQKLMLSVGMAVASGNASAVAIATSNLIAFKNRHIEKSEADNTQLIANNTRLYTDNKALAGEILTWNDRNKLNAGVRKLAAVTQNTFSGIWLELYKNLQYKYGICLKQRGNKPYIQWVREDEWNSVIKTFCAICTKYEKSPSEMFQQVIDKK